MKKLSTLILLAILSFFNAYSNTTSSSIDGTWYVKEIGIYANNFNWEEWGWDKYEMITNYLPALNPELDNVITFTETGTNGDGKPIGTYENNVGEDGLNGAFTDTDKSWDFTDRLRTVPTGTGTWVLDGTAVTITVGGVDYILNIEAGSSADEMSLATPLDYLSDQVSWTDTDWSYEELAHTSQKMWYSLTKTVSEPDLEPVAPMNVQVTNVTSDSFTLTWENDPLSTGTNIFIEDPEAASGNIYVTTAAQGVTSYVYTGDQNGVTISGDKVYIARLEALPDADYNAYTEALVNMNEPNGNTFAYDPNFHIYICFGQSNMEGAAIPEAQDRVAKSRFQVMQSLSCPNLGRESGKWYSAIAPLCQCYTGLSVADYFGRTMVDNLPNEVSVGVVHVAIGGSDIRVFDKDIYGDYLDTYPDAWFQDKLDAYGRNPYQHLIDLAKEAQKSGVIKGILLHQGETNAGDANWPSYVQSVYNNMLTDLSLNANEVPLLAGQVGHSDQGGQLSDMNTIIDQLPSTVSTAHVISSSGCTIQDDNIHFDAAGVRELGSRYANKMMEILNGGATDVNDNRFEGYKLGQNVPNPVSNSAKISFNIAQAGQVSLKVYSAQGAEITELVGSSLNAGSHSVEFNSDNLSSGIYFYTIKVNGYVETRKMIVSSL
ncbi:sialate O-acetylesterase [Labilibacter marinus]|uniref:sialate O-acetylesterase n=1 Tax=Labilibacter marinus TaxID=1477105 RepID=UPI0008349A4F|nr:sialate O-acetylesterase [Labilibacter marinus]